MNTVQVSGPLVAGDASTGSLLHLPWDEETFGFPVGQWSGADWGALTSRQWELAGRMVQESPYAVISTSVPADDNLTKSRLCNLGFKAVENAVFATCSMNGRQLPKSRLALRTAETRDAEAICNLASSIFSFGRYMSDGDFPKELAGRRYGDWVRRSMSAANERIVVFDDAEHGIQGFMIFALNGDRLGLRLGGFRPDSPKRIYASELWSHALDAGRQAGAKIVEVTFAAENLPILNMYSAWGFRFKSVSTTFHLTRLT